MSDDTYLTLDELGKEIHERLNDRFEDRSMPTESVSENFIHQIVHSILEELQKENKIPFIPSFKTLNKTSMEERFSDSIPDFSKHINLVGLDKEQSHDEFGVMNIAFDGEGAEDYEQAVSRQKNSQAEEQSNSDTSTDQSAKQEQTDNEASNDDVDIPDYLTVIEGGKSKR